MIPKSESFATSQPGQPMHCRPLSVVPGDFPGLAHLRRPIAAAIDCESRVGEPLAILIAARERRIAEAGADLEDSTLRLFAQQSIARFPGADDRATTGTQPLGDAADKPRFIEQVFATLDDPHEVEGLVELDRLGI